MRALNMVLLVLLLVACHGEPKAVAAQTPPAGSDSATLPGDLRITACVDTSDQGNREAIACLRRFFAKKLDDEAENDYWYGPDTVRYAHIFNELRYAEYDSIGDLRYPPMLVEVRASVQPGDRMLRVRYAAEGSDGSPQAPRYLFNFHARSTDKGMRLSFPIEENTRNWERRTIGPITYIISPQQTFKPNEAEQQDLMARLGSFFDVAPSPITYYAFAHAQDLYRSCGFDAHPLMSVIPTGGMVDAAGNVYAGRSAFYLHELVHVYADRRQRAINGLFGEGIATLIGGSGDHDYAWHRANLKRYLEADPAIDLRDRCNTHMRDEIEGQTSVPYMIGALLCERILRVDGKAGLFKAFASGDDQWPTLAAYGITPATITAELRKELKHDPVQPLGL